MPARRDKPLLFVDVDGVINCFGDLGHSLVSFEEEFVALGRYRIKVPVGTRQALGDLSDAFECVWATTWQRHAQPEIGDRLGVTPPWPHLPLPDDEEGEGETEKLSAIRGYVAHRPAAWIDDLLSTDAHVWAAERTAAGTPTLLVQTRPDTGITGGHLNTLLAWAAGL
jgi:hypothetical protein